MTRTFIQTDEFVKRWEALGLTDADLRRLELEIMKNPQAGVVVPETGKLRKLRFAFENAGKRGSTRVCYVDFFIHKTVYLITVYAKNEKDDLSRAEQKQIKKLIDVLEKSIEKGGECNEWRI